MLHGYQLENVVGVIEGVKNDQPLELLLKGLDPLGYFPELKNIRTVEGDDYATLYQQVLVDLPIGLYFRKFLDNSVAVMQGDDKGGSKKDSKFISDLMKDFKAEKIKNLLKKIWIMEFHKFSMKYLPDTSKAILDDLLKFESDCMTIQIIYNSLDIKGLSDARGREGERKKYINALGHLYPERDKLLTDSDTYEKLKDAVKSTPYEPMLNRVTDAPSKEKGNEFSS
jgi:V-type H+-transporting ATPase subunit d